MQPLADNPALTDPAGTLTLAEQQALLAIGYYRHQARRAGFVLIGTRRVTPAVLARLRAHRLIKGEVPNLAPTIAGGLVIDRLKRGLHGRSA